MSRLKFEEHNHLQSKSLFLCVRHCSVGLISICKANFVCANTKWICQSSRFRSLTRIQRVFFRPHIFRCLRCWDACGALCSASHFFFGCQKMLKCDWWLRLRRIIFVRKNWNNMRPQYRRKHFMCSHIAQFAFKSLSVVFCLSLTKSLKRKFLAYVRLQWNKWLNERNTGMQFIRSKNLISFCTILLWPLRWICPENSTVCPKHLAAPEYVSARRYVCCSPQFANNNDVETMPYNFKIHTHEAYTTGERSGIIKRLHPPHSMASRGQRVHTVRVLNSTSCIKKK